nr:phosphatidylinositol transfer protein 3-like [Coffea arabica]XP_027089749.1 phosphatidylinositol transfer protein 3-like [Coffea arabica]
MSSGTKTATSNGIEISVFPEAEKEKINEVRRSIGPLSGKLALFCSDACIARYLRARNWNVKKAVKMLKASLKWRREYKPEEIRWEDVAHEAETGKIYRSNYKDKLGRTVLVMRPRCQNSKSIKGQIKYLVYCMENAIVNLPENQEQMVWLIDFHGFNMSHISVKVTKETAHVLQEHYPERLGMAVLYDAPKIFEPFWKVVKPFLEPKTANKVKFVYSDDSNAKKILEELFDMDQLEPAFGGKQGEDFDISKYSERMKEDDKKVPLFWKTEGDPAIASLPVPALDASTLESDSDTSDGKADGSSHEADTDDFPTDNPLPATKDHGNGENDTE